VQLRNDAGMPIEDAGVEWREDKAPFVTVATLRVAQQEFRTTERDELSEALTFSPAHAATPSASAQTGTHRGGKIHAVECSTRKAD